MKRAGLLAGLALLLAGAGEPAEVPRNQATEHVVKPGETLGGIANRAEVPRVIIIEANGLKPPYHVRAGQKLMIPRTRQHTVIAGETGFTIAYAYGVPWREIAVANGMEPDAPLRTGQKLLIPTVLRQPAPAPAASASPAPVAGTPTRAATPRFAWPVQGTVRRGFSARGRADYHDGLDIRAPQGTAVRAAAAGTVLFAGEDPRQFGKLVVVDHPGGYQTAYAFLSRITVKEEEDVSAGERVGLVGNTGMAKGYELHFEIRQDDRPIDPDGLLPARP